MLWMSYSTSCKMTKKWISSTVTMGLLPGNLVFCYLLVNVLKNCVYNYLLFIYSSKLLGTVHFSWIYQPPGWWPQLLQPLQPAVRWVQEPERLDNINYLVHQCSSCLNIKDLSVLMLHIHINYYLACITYNYLWHRMNAYMITKKYQSGMTKCLSMVWL